MEYVTRVPVPGDPSFAISLSRCPLLSLTLGLDRAARRERPPPGGPRASRRASSQWARGLGGGRDIKGSAPRGARSRLTWTRRDRDRYRHRRHIAATAHRTVQRRRQNVRQTRPFGGGEVRQEEAEEN